MGLDKKVKKNSEILNEVSSVVDGLLDQLMLMVTKVADIEKKIEDLERLTSGIENKETIKGPQDKED